MTIDKEMTNGVKSITVTRAILFKKKKKRRGDLQNNCIYTEIEFSQQKKKKKTLPCVFWGHKISEYDLNLEHF